MSKRITKNLKGSSGVSYEPPVMDLIALNDNIVTFGSNEDPLYQLPFQELPNPNN